MSSSAEAGSRPVVRVVPLQPHCFAFGGFELQMINAMRAASATGVDLAPLDPWRRDADFSHLHLWGLDPQHQHLVHWAHLAGKKLVMSALVAYPGPRTRMRFLASWALGPGRGRAAMARALDAITVVNRRQAEYLVSVLGVPADRVAVIPNIVEEIFFDPPAEAAGFHPPSDPYVLSTGNICRRKNQLALVKACRRLGVGILLVGEPLTGEEDYASAVEEAMRGNPRCTWVRGMAAGSEALAAAYRRAALFALVSHGETQPISALEAVAAGTPLLLSARAYSRQEYFANAATANPESAESIARGIRRGLEAPDRHRAPRAAVEPCRFAAVGEAYAAVYRGVF